MCHVKRPRCGCLQRGHLIPLSSGVGVREMLDARCSLYAIGISDSQYSNTYDKTQKTHR
jgi:hypothetical protein